MKNKIISPDEIDRISVLSKGKRIVFCGGCFDIFHYGHLVFLTAAKASGDILIVQVESDEFIKKRKKRIPVHNQEQRCSIIAALECVDLVLPIPLLNGDSEYGDIVSKLKPAVIAVTEGDIAIDKKRQHAEAVGAEVRSVCPPFSSFSSSNIGKYEGIFSD